MSVRYENIRHDLETLLPIVGQKLLDLRREAEGKPDFSRQKADKTLVTKGDLLAEDLIRTWIENQFPGDAIRGEERPEKAGGSRMWVIDPIDGTHNYSNFGSKFAISVGMAVHNVPVIGVLYYPAEEVLLSAAENSGARLNETQNIFFARPADPSSMVIIAQSRKLHAEYFAQPQFAQQMGQEARLMLSEPKDPGSNWSLTYAFLEFLESDGNALLHPGATPYDIGAICSIAKELGLPFSDYEGKSVDFTKDYIPFVVSKNELLHDQIIKKLNSAD